MITDSQTNQLYLADCLPKNYPKFFEEFEKVLSRCDIKPNLLSPTKDIWARDYMPIQISKERFIQFTYDPDYLKPKKYQKTISDVDGICKTINIEPIKSNLIVDGGNIVKYSDKVIMCDKVFHENKNIPERDLINELKKLLQIDKIIFVPWDKSDIIGHADGMVRFVDDSTVVINDYSKEKPEYQRCFRMSLQNAGLDWVELPYTPDINTNTLSAEGIYTNFLQTNQVVIVPTFNRHEDNIAVKILEQVFKGQSIATVNSNEIAKEGGILNCISWNIKQ